MVAELALRSDGRAPAREQDWRTPGCTDRCESIIAFIPGRYGREELLLHHAPSHERYGRSIADLPGRGSNEVATGRLLVRLSLCEAYRDGDLLRLTPTEWRMLAVLAGRLGHVVPSSDLLLLVWGYRNSVVRPNPEDHHLLRVHVARLRAKLGACRPLLETRPGLGYRLLAEPPVVGVS